MTATPGRYYVQRRTYANGPAYVVLDLATNPPGEIGRPHPTQAGAQHAADHLNTPPAPRPRQAALFDPEVS